MIDNRFRSTFDQAAVGIAHVTPAGAFAEVNRRFCEITGYAATELLRLNLTDLAAARHLAVDHAALQAMLDGSQSAGYGTEKSFRDRDGNEQWIALNVTLVRDAAGAPDYFIVVIEPITGRKQAEFRLQRMNRLYSVLRQVGQAIVGNLDRQQLFDAACRIAVEYGGLSMVMIAEVDPASGKVHPAANFGSGVAYTRELQISIHGERGLGTVGTALRSGQHDVCNDIERDPRMRPWQAGARQWGFRATASFPLKVTGRTIGVLVLFAAEVGYFQDDEIDLMQAIAGELSFALEAIERAAQNAQAQAALAASEASLVEAQRIARLGSWEWDVEHDHLRWSAEVYRLLGLEPGTFADVLPTQAFLDAVHPDDVARVAETLGRSLRNAAPFDLHYRVLLPDGLERRIHSTGQVFVDAAGKVARMAGIAQDVTERHRAEAQMMRLADRLTNTLESITDAFYTLDLEWAFTYVNREAERLLRRPRDQLLGRNVWEVFPEAVDSIVDREYRRALAENCMVEFELYYAPLEFWTEVRAYPSDEGLVVYFRDVTERKRAEQDHHRAEQTRAAILYVQQEIVSTELGLDEAMSLMAERASALTGASASTVELVEGDDLVYRAATGMMGGVLGQRLRRDRSLSGRAVETGEVLFSEDSESDPRADGAAVRRLGVRAMIAAPLRIDDAFVGVLKVLSDRPRAFSAADVSSMQILAESLGAVMQRHRAAERLRASEAQYRLLFDSNPHPMWVFDVSTLRFLAVNYAAVQQYGHSVDEFLHMNIHEIRSPDAIGELRKALSMGEEGKRYLGIWQHRRKDGSVLDVEITSDRILFDGRVARLVLAHDVTERLRTERELARVSRAQRLLSRCVEAQVRGEEEIALLTEICQIAIEVGGYRMAWVGYAAHDAGRSIVPAAWAGAELGYLSEISLSWSADHATGHGPAGRTIRSGEPTVATDIHCDDAGFHWRRAAEQRGYRGVICLPLRTGTETLGVISLYTGEVQPIGDEEIQLLRQLADDLAFGIANLRSQRRSRQLHNTMVKMAAGVSATTGTGFLEQLGRSMTEALGADAGYVVRLDATTPGLARSIFMMVGGEVVDNVEYQVRGTPCADVVANGQCVVTADVATLFAEDVSIGEQRMQSYVGRRLDNSQGMPIGLLCVMFRHPLENPDFVASTLQVFAARAAAEMERLEADARIREQASLLDRAQDAIILHAVDGHRVLYWNEGAHRQYGWSATEALGQALDRLLQIDPGEASGPFQTVLAHGEWSGHFNERRKDGSAMIAEVRCTLVRDEVGRPRSILSIMSDITERRRAEEKLKLALEELGTRNRELQDFAFVASHDLQEPLRKIRMFSDRLVSRPIVAEDAQARDYLQRSAQAAARMQTLIDDLLQYSRIDSKARSFVQVRLGALLATVVDDLEQRIESAAADLRIGPMPTIEADHTQLRQLFQNLLANALKFRHPERRPCIRVYAQTAHLDGRPAYRISVEDNGIGFDAKYAERIFAPFQRLHSREDYEGTGIGLAIVRRIVDRHRGTVEVDAASGQGATFHVVLPERQPQLVLDRGEA
jgi:PAS domain S-box-containing protein